MRLTKIKLAGFKSFVDPTVVNFPSNLVGVVGPNGCGKSNIIDAVRWVMGEISAKHLRGESMADVIFNGSSGRKPVGTASVELVFDNSDGKLGRRVRGLRRGLAEARRDARRPVGVLPQRRRAAARTSRSCSSAPASARAATRSSSRA
jgi:chromosome segregation ATPase